MIFSSLICIAHNIQQEIAPRDSSEYKPRKSIPTKRRAASSHAKKTKAVRPALDSDSDSDSDSDHPAKKIHAESHPADNLDDDGIEYLLAAVGTKRALPSPVSYEPPKS
jgi:hypothetical protein